MSLLQIRSLEAGYGNVPILHGLDLHVEEGEIVLLFGANGAGKSTMLKAIFGLLPRKGEVQFRGADLNNVPAERLAALGMGYAPQDGNTFPDLTVEENLRLAASIADRHEREQLIGRIWDLFPRLLERRNQRASTLSGGEQKMLAIAGAIVPSPILVALDEATSGLAPSIVDVLVEQILHLRSQGIAVLWVVGENAKGVVSQVDRAYLLQSGRIEGEWTPDALLTDERLIEAFFGIDGSSNAPRGKQANQ